MENKKKTHIAQILILGALLIAFSSCVNNETYLFAQKTGSFSDPRDGKVYKIVKIGDQWIMSENLAYKPDRGNYWAYGNDSTNVTKYGYLYDWKTATMIAPPGWHLPSKKEWKIFRKSLGARMDVWWTMDKVYQKMISGGSSGFNALFGGVCNIANNEFKGIGDVAYFWSSTNTSDGPTIYVVDRISGDAFLTNYADPGGGKSVRLFKD